MALLALVLGCTPAARATLQPIGLRVEKGEEAWHAERIFALQWTNPPGSIAAVHYRLLDPSGQITLSETTLAWPATGIQRLMVPPTPGAYIAQVWLEDASGEEGTPLAAQLRFDDAAPGQVEPLADSGWIGRADLPYTLQLSHPGGPQPLSGIRGYAVSVDTAASGAPCAGRYTCSETETDLHGGIAEDSLSIAELPEGDSYVHAVAVSGSGIRSALSGSAVLRVDKTDPVTKLAGAPDGWSNRPLALTVTANDAASGMAPTAARGPFTAIRVDDGVPTVASGDTVATTLIASGIHTVAYYASDAAGNVADGGFTNGKPNGAPETALVRIDREAPSLGFANAQDPQNPEKIEVHASDVLSGLDRSRGSIGLRPAGSGERFEELPTELSGGLLRSRWDSEAYPPGEYEFRATAFDLAGNSASTVTRGSGAPMRLHSPLKIATSLRIDIDKRERSFSGRLIAGRRTPLTGMPVQVVERFDVGAEPRERVSTVRTDEAGAFSVHLRPGPSRQVLALAPATATLRGASSQPLQLAVPGDVRMRVSSPVARVGGRPVVFRGKVAGVGVPIPAEGKIVQLQFRLRGLPWSEFRTVRTDPEGRFRYAYRFADDDSRGARFQFRAFAPAQAGWPFEPAGSRPVKVRGR